MALSLGLSGTAVGAPANTRRIAGRADDPVIVVLRAPLPSSPADAAGAARRAASAEVAQRSVVADLRAGASTHVRSLHIIDAVAATVSTAQAAALAATPGVAEVVPDASFRGPDPVRSSPIGTRTAGRDPVPAPGVCPSPGRVQLDPEGVEAVHAVSGVADAPTARKLGFTGAGVTVGDIAVGIDPTEPELIRPDGQRVIDHYVDFTGEGTAEQGGEDLESYLDDSLLAAQGRLVYDLHDYTPLMPKGCDIELHGVAPGITLDAYKVYANDDQTTTSAFLEAIDHAVDVDHVNVLNEEGGAFPMPDTSQDLIKQANVAAMAAGVTVTSPSYDAGAENTIWSPSSQRGVISTGASTAFRTYAQGDIGGYGEMKADGWVSDNVSSLSSGGSTESGRSIDVVAPGDLDWIACEKDTAACGSDNLTIEGGTSESGPIVAGVAALVIQAFRSTHRGATPSPALVRNIISSTADDLGMPGSLQGAGLVDAYRAVRAAMTADHGSARVAGPALVAHAQQLSSIGRAGAAATMSFDLTNDGLSTTSARLAGRSLGPATTVLHTTLHEVGRARGRIFHFTLRHPADLLTADIAYPGASDSVPAAISLVEPDGRLAAYSQPQGPGGHGQAEVRRAPAGVWEADVGSIFGGYSGVVHVQITSADTRPWGQVSPSEVTLAPGRSTRVTVVADRPGVPGDVSASVTWRTPGAPGSSLPVTLRSLVPIVHGVGHFTGDLVGGNGRGYVPAQTFFFQFDVPSGEPALDVQTELTRGNEDTYGSFLVAPDGEAVAQAGNQLVVGESGDGPVTVDGPGARLHTLSPPPGRWTVIVTFANPVTGNRLHTSLGGTVSFAPVTVAATGLPDSRRTTLRQGSDDVVALTVHNDGVAPESYFLDARANRTVSVPLDSFTGPAVLHLPLTDFDAYPQWIVPTDTSSLTANAVSSVPTTFDFDPYNGEPDIGAVVSGDRAHASVAAADLTQGDWAVVPQQIGPFGAGGAKRSTTRLSLDARTKAFDPAVTSGTGDLWEQGKAARTAFRPTIVQPGQTATVYAVIVPSARVGTVVEGVLYLDDSTAVGLYGTDPSGDQLVALPYAYRVD